MTLQSSQSTHDRAADLLAATPPTIGVGKIGDVVMDRFGIGGTTTALASERDQYFLLSQSDTPRFAVVHRLIARLRLLESEADHSGRRLAQGHFGAEQFLQLVVSAPQRRALGLGTAMSTAERARWARDAVALFLGGCWGMKPP